MKAAVYKGVERVEVEDVPAPQAGADDIVVEVSACGICGSDLHSYQHGAFVQPGQVMGHEFVGDVAAVGHRVSDIVVGDRVTVCPIVPCMHCARCAEGRYNLCPHLATGGIAYGRPGAFAEYVQVPNAVLGQNVFRIDRGLGDESGALVEPLACAVHAVKLASVVGTTALVLGLGPIGQMVVHALKGAGVARVLATDLSRLRLDAAAASGAEVLDSGGGLRSAVEPALGPDGEIDIVFECTGVPSLLAAAVEHVKPSGVVIILALYDDPLAIDASILVQKEVRLQGSIAYNAEDFDDAIRLITEGIARVEPLITQRHLLANIEQAFSDQLQKDTSIKVLVRPK